MYPVSPFNLNYVPKAAKNFDSFLFDQIKSQLQNANRVTIITGAGVSTASGIPDYRSPGVGLYARNKKHKPILGHELAKNKFKRYRYWARNFIGYSSVKDKVPNSCHEFLSKWEHNRLRDLKPSQHHHLITQNVDGLHALAGSRNLTELHGAMNRKQSIRENESLYYDFSGHCCHCRSFTRG